MPTQITEPAIAATVKRCRAGRVEQTLTDSKAEGLILRVTETGTPSWLFRYRFGGRRKNITIGRYPAWGIADAREKARALRRAVDEGIDVAVEKQRRKHEEAKAKTVGDVAAHYFNLASRDVAESTLLARRGLYENYIAGITALSANLDKYLVTPAQIQTKAKVKLPEVPKEWKWQKPKTSWPIPEGCQAG